MAETQQGQLPTWLDAASLWKMVNDAETNPEELALAEADFTLSGLSPFLQNQC